MGPYSLYKSLAFQLDPETVHHFTLKWAEHFPQVAKLLGRNNKEKKFHLKTTHLDWSFPIGLAAGLDKNAQAISFFEQLGFGSVEVGTVTPEAQAGNGKPRIFRYPKDLSLRNSMGFPNDGQDAIEKRLKNYKGKISIGVNIGKNKQTRDSDAWKDYQMLYQKFAPLSDYLVINISSPNTPGLRELQKSENFDLILESLKDVRDESYRPLFVKISPDISEKQLMDLVESVKKHKLAGIVATNTSKRDDLGPGGISGKLLKEKSRFIRNKTLELLKETPQIELIGVGGVDSFADLLDFWQHGGKLMQVYTSFIYQGPALLCKIERSIQELLKQTGSHGLQELLDSHYFTKQ